MNRLWPAVILGCCMPGRLCAQNITDTSNGTMSALISFTVTPGTSNTPVARTVSFRIRCADASGYHVAASASYVAVPSAPTDGGATIAASDIGVGITSVDTSSSQVIKPRTDTIAYGFDYDPGAVSAPNGLTPYAGRAAGQATVADLVGSPGTTILSGDRIAAGESPSDPNNYITVTMTFALLPQYFTPGIFTVALTLSIMNGP